MKFGNTLYLLSVIALSFLFIFCSSKFVSGDSWTKKANMPTERYGLCCGMVDGKIYAIGGTIDTNNPLTMVEQYDPRDLLRRIRGRLKHITM